MDTILPADSYLVINRTILNDSDRKILSMLYQPIVGVDAINLYLTLWMNLDQSEIMSTENIHHDLMCNMRKTLNEILVAREKLEAIGLLKTYFKDGKEEKTYIYELFSPLSASEFFSHPILNIVFYNNVGEKEYRKILMYFKIPKISLKGYKDITKTFDEIFESIPSNNFYNATKDIRMKKILNLQLNDHIDFNYLLASFPKGIINEKTFNKDIKDLINKLSYIYSIDVDNMKNIILSSLDKNLMIDKVKLRKNTRNYYEFNNDLKLPTLIHKNQPEYLRNSLNLEGKRGKLIHTFETVSPYKFLSSKYNGSKPTSRDLKLIENLIIDVGLTPAVINVLIDYVMKVNDKKLSKNFVETIAGQWKRLNIMTAVDAMNQVEKEIKNKNKKAKVTRSYTKKEKELPDWFEKDNKKEEISNEEKEELDEMLKEFK